MKKNNLDADFKSLLNDIMTNGTFKDDRTGTGTISVFSREIRHKMSNGFPLLTSKKVAWKSIVVELLWFLRGGTNIKYLVDNGCNIWNGDCYKQYLKIREEVLSFEPPTSDKLLREYLTYYQQINSIEEFIKLIKSDEDFAKKHGELGPIYGKQWRAWDKSIDQISQLIKDLKENPDSRRLMINAWNVSDLTKMTLPPCHYAIQCYTRVLSDEERFKYFTNQEGFFTPLKLEDVPTRALSLKWNQRSVDTFLGLPFNIASYGLLLMLLAREVNMIPDELIGSLGDVHLYSNHIEQAKKQIGRNYTLEERLKLCDSDEAYYAHSLGDNTYRDVILLDNNTPYETRPSYELPTMLINNKGIFDLNVDDFKLINYKSNSKIDAPLSN